MPNLSILLTQTFLDHFHYCDATGRRSNTSIVKRFFFDNELTTALETLANETTIAMRGILNDCKQDNLERINDIYTLLNTARTRAWELRLEFGTTSHTSSTGHGYGPAYTSETTKPKRQSKFERELVAALKAMKAAAEQALSSAPDTSDPSWNAFRVATLDCQHQQALVSNNARKPRINAWAE